VTSVNGKTGDVVLTAGDINLNTYSMDMVEIPDDVISTAHSIEIPLTITADNYDSSELTGIVT
jgi:hypothetical protein